MDTKNTEKDKAKERVRLTQASIATLRKRAADLRKSDTTFWDTEIRGFGLRVRESGACSWVYQYQKGYSQGKITIGDVNDYTADAARQRAREQRGEIDLGGDPAAQKALERAKDKQTFAGIVDLYMSAKQTEWRPASLRAGRRYLTATFQSLHRIPTHKIQKRDISAIVTRIAATHRGAAGAALAHVNACLNWAVDNGLIDDNPADGIPAPKHNVRDRVLSDDELRRVWLACSGDSDACRIVRLLILTGQRREEISGMAEEELDRENGIWTLPKERAKNHRAHTLELPEEAWKIIGPPSRTGRLFGRGGRGGFSAWQGFRRALNKRCDVAKWVLHDIRRSVATGMADIGIQPHIIEAVLNHVSGHKAGIAGIYNRASYQREKRNALAVWADHVASIVSGEEKKILRFSAETEQAAP